MILHALLSTLGDEIQDTDEGATTIPSQDLGMVDPKASEIDVSVGKRNFIIQQAPGLLSSDRDGGTTGAALWRVTPFFAEWMGDQKNMLFTTGVLNSESRVVELGCGISGLLAMTVSPLVELYIATDQEYSLKRLRYNVAANMQPTTRDTRRSKSKGRHLYTKEPKIIMQILDWEDSIPSSLPTFDGGFNAVVACDTVYNYALVDPFVQTCTDICALKTGDEPTICVVAQQLRQPDVFDTWLKRFLTHFRCWRVPDDFLTEDLREGKGFVVHVGVLR
ncbi:Ribosomal protein lysine methyltransferase [Elasticomyces elasticus]|nr:Ribosomal protein lysine methyltransferase [Elasticomyces elasticus]